MNVPDSSRRSARGVWIAIVGIVLAVLAAAWVTVRMLLPPERVRTIVQQQLSKTLARDVRFDDAGVSIFPPVRLTVSRVAMSEAGGFARGLAFEASAIHLDLDALALLRHRLVVRRLGLDDPGIHLVLEPDGSTNWEGVIKPTPPGTHPSRPMDLHVDELAVSRGRLLVDDLKHDRRSTVLVDTRVSIAAEAATQRYATSGSTRISGYAFGPLSASRVADLDTALAKVELRLDHQGAYDGATRRLALDRLDMKLGSARLAARGVVDHPGPRARLDLHASGQGVDFGEILRVLAVADARAVHGIHGSGRMDFDLTLRGLLTEGLQRIATGVVRVENAAFQYPGAPAKVEALSFTAHLAPDSLGIGDLVARVAGQPLSARLVATHFADPVVDFAVRGNVDLAAVAPLVAPKDTKVGGRASVNVAGRGRAKDPASMSLAGGARLDGVSLESSQLPKRIEQVNGTIAFSQTQARVTGLSGRAGTSSFAVDADVTKPLALLAKPGTTAPSNVRFDFRAPRLDLAEVLPPSQGPPVVLNAVGGGAVRIDRLINQRLDVSAVRAQVQLQPGIVSASSFAMNAYGGAVSGSGGLDLRDPKRPAISLKTTLDSLSAGAFVGTWVRVKDLVQGRLNSTFDFSVAGATPNEMKRTLTAAGVAQIFQGSIGPSKVLSEVAALVRMPALERLRFDDAKVPFHIDRGRLINEPATLRGGYGEWKVAGSVGFDGSLDYAVSATLPPSIARAISAQSALAAGALTDANGNVLLDLRVTGSWSSPRVAWDPRAMRDRVAGRVSEALQQQQQKVVDELRAAAAARESTSTDSARRVVTRLRQAAADSVRRKAGELLRGFFGGGGARDTTKP